MARESEERVLVRHATAAAGLWLARSASNCPTPSPSPHDDPKSRSNELSNAQAADVPTILAMIKELAAYEHAADEVQATEESLLATLSFSPASAPERGYARTILVFDDGEPAGMALYFYNYSTWTSRPGIFLEDLFVRPQHRRKGFGQRLLGELAGEVLRVQGARLDWNVLKWNEPSIKFYETIGAKPQSEWMTMRADGEALVELAKSGKGLADGPGK